MSKDLPIYMSHSAQQCYKECAEKYHLKYLEKVKPIEVGASLAFGIAIDNAVGHLLNCIKDGKKDEGVITFRSVFLGGAKGWNTALDNADLRYRQKDYDDSILTDPDDKNQINQWEIEHDLKSSDAIKFEKQKDHRTLQHNEFELFNKLCWISLKNKGLLMLDAFERDILPNITKVIAVQHKFEGMIDEKTPLSGYIDFILEYKGYDKPIVFDLKTSAMLYEQDSVFLSEQLTLYVAAVGEDLDTELAGFIVLLKNIGSTSVCSICNHLKDTSHKTCDQIDVKGKRCHGAWIETPKANTQVLINTISREKAADYVDSFTNISTLMKTGIRVKNYNSCKMYGGFCDYFKLCHFGDRSGLISKEKKDDV